ncbi:MAG: hypothetical protein P4M11_03825, partial [Candidatus Pacebacteria bacterium]|nr:hypothetical protein [Candidatus Paceibacterota bacterium]
MLHRHVIPVFICRGIRSFGQIVNMRLLIEFHRLKVDITSLSSQRRVQMQRGEEGSSELASSAAVDTAERVDFVEGGRGPRNRRLIISAMSFINFALLFFFFLFLLLV